MAINFPQAQDVIKSFKKRKILVTILLYLAAACAAFALNSLRHRDITLTGLSYYMELGLGLGIGTIALVVAFFVWRCPACGKFLGLSTKTKVCGKCNTIFVGEDENKDKPVMTIFKRKRLISYIIFAFLFISILTLFTIAMIIQSKVPFIIMFVILALSVIYSFISWRCPKCNSYLGRSMNPSNCPNCGVRLRQ